MHSSTKIAISSLAAASSATAVAIRATTSTHPRVLPRYDNWINPTCYWDLYADDRQLPTFASSDLNSTNMTIKSCLDWCDGKGFGFGGLEYGAECYCGNKEPDERWDGGHCDVPCSGEPMHLCGGPQSLLVYQKLS